MYESIEEIWPDYPSREDFLFNEDEYWSLFLIDTIWKALHRVGLFFISISEQSLICAGPHL
jgi:hypothetical protein